MTVYRITTAQWSNKLTASGFPARWSSKGSFVIYTAQSRALACLENLVHRTGIGSNAIFRVMVINIPHTVSIEQLQRNKLKKDWNTFENYSYCQGIGDQWVQEARSAILRVPSAIVDEEFNYLLNPNHPEFNKIKLMGDNPFLFDPRFQ
jgi:RES domain-containing protein